MATHELGVIHLSLMKQELRISTTDTSQDDLIEFQIGASISYFEKDLGVPVLDRKGSLRAERPFANSESPICFRTKRIRTLSGVRYWTETDELRLEPTGTISTADLGRSGYGADGYYYIYPPDGGWPVILDDSYLIADVVTGWEPTPPGLRQALILGVRQLYEGHDEIRPTHAMLIIADPFRSYAIDPDEALGEFIHVVSPGIPETPVAPATPVTPTPGALRYLAISPDNMFDASEFTDALTGVSSQFRTLRVPAYANVERFLGFAVPDAEPDITDITTGGFDVFMAFERISGTITIQGVDYKVWRSRVIQNDRASGVLYSFTQ